MDRSYSVILTGRLEEGVTPEHAVNGFSKQFKVSAAVAGQYLDGSRRTIKKGLDLKRARQFQAALGALGIVAQVMDNESPASPEIPADKSQPPAPPRSGEESAGRTAPAESHAPAVVSCEEDHPGYAFTIEGKPDYGFLTVTIPANETLKVEASAMATMDVNVSMKTRVKGGLGRFLTGESIFLNDFSAQGGPGEIGIAPGPPGDIAHQYLDGNTIYLQNSSYVASTEGVNLETKWQGLVKGFFSGESLFLIRCSGKGDLWFNTYGALIEIDVTGDYVVDTGNIVAFTESLDYSVTSVGGYKSLFFSGEGLVCRFSGKGKVWIQTRKAGAFLSWVNFFRPAK